MANAGSGSYTVKINATGGDAALKELQKLNREMAAAQKPANDYAKALKKYEDLSGITKNREMLAAADKAHRESVKKTWKQIEGLNDRLQAGTEKALKMSGAILGIGALGSAAGIVALSKSFGTSSLGLTNMSRNLGITADQLLRYHNAFQKVGVSAGDVDSAFHSAGQNLQDVVAGRNPQLGALMKGVLHIDPTAGAFKAKTFSEQSDEILTAISKISDPRLQENVLNMFGAGALLPAVENIKKYKDALKSTADVSVSYAADGMKLYDSFTDLSQSSEQLGRTVADVLGPAMTPFIDDAKELVKTFDSWLVANKDIIDTDLAAWLKPVDDGIKEFTTWLKNADVHEIGKDIEYMGEGFATIVALKVGATFIDIASSFLKVGAALTTMNPMLSASLAVVGSLYLAWTRTKDALDDYYTAEAEHQKRKADRELPNEAATASAYNSKFEAMGAAGTLPTQALRDKWAKERNHAVGGTARGPIDLSAYNGLQDKAFAAFEGMGYTHAQAAGLVSNLISESGLKKGAVGDSGLAYGIGQWHGDRQAIFKKVFGHDIKGSSLEEQLRFVDYEMHNSERSALSHLLGASSAYDAGDAISRYYERPRARDEAAHNRGNLAAQLAQSHIIHGNINANIHISGNTGGVHATASASGHAFKNAPVVHTQVAPVKHA